MPWQKGQSGNPAGKQRGVKYLLTGVELLKAANAKAGSLGAKYAKSERPWAEYVIDLAIKAAKMGDMTLIKQLNDKVISKMPDEATPPLKVIVEWQQPTPEKT